MVDKVEQGPSKEMKDPSNTQVKATDDIDGSNEAVADMSTGQGYNPSARGLGAGLEVPKEDEQMKRAAWHKFWGSQPVCDEETMDIMTNCEEADQILVQTVEDIPVEPVSLQGNGRLDLSNKLYWDEIDLDQEDALDEVYKLLRQNYVEDDGANFRFEYSKEFLRWTLMVPGKKKQWHVCLRTKSSNRMVGFISGVPVTMKIHHKTVKCVEINFLCAMKQFRELGLAPILISEITRRVRREGVFQAVYTSGLKLPGSYIDCRYYHRTLDFKKLLSIGFTYKPQNMTMDRILKKIRVPQAPCGLEDGAIWRKPTVEDASRMKELLDRQFQRVSCGAIWKGASYDENGNVDVSNLERTGALPLAVKQRDEKNHTGSMRYHPDLSIEEIKHYLITPDESVIKCRVREVNGEISDFVSYYSLPSQVLNPLDQITKENHNYTHLEAAYSYLSAGNLSREELLKSALHFAKADGFDVFNALVMGNQTVELLKELLFGAGDGSLHHYAFNWKGPRMTEKDIGLILC